MDFQQFQQSRWQLAAKHDEHNNLTEVGGFIVYVKAKPCMHVEQWCRIDGIHYYPSDDLDCVFFYGRTGLHIEKLRDGSHLLNIENESISSDLEKLELVLYHFACGECYFGSKLQEQEIIRCYMIDQCEKIDLSGTYRDSHCVADGLQPMDFYEACRQFVKLKAPNLIK